MERGPDSRREGQHLVRSALVMALIALPVFALAYRDGGYGLADRGSVAVAVCWGVIAAIGFRLAPTASLPWACVAGALLIGGLAVWTLASTMWSPSVEAAYLEFVRVTLFLGVYVLVLLLARQGSAGRFADGIAVAVSGVVLVALLSRISYGLFPDRGLATSLPSAVTRLSFPVGYWNGLGILVALGIPLLFRIALVGRSPYVRAAAIAPIPAAVAVIYLTSSRGAVAAAVVGSFTFLWLTARRWSAAGALSVAGLGSAAAIIVLQSRGVLVNGPLDSALASTQGRSAAVLIAACGATSSALYALGARLLGGRFRPGRSVGYAVASFMIAILLAGVFLARPVERFDSFRTSPSAGTPIDQGNFVASHLLSGNGSGRWQFWIAALDEWRAHPLLGGGAGSYEQWWAQYGSFSYFLRDAHSLYVEQLAELGPIGLALIVALVFLGVACGISRSRRAEGADRVTTAALTATVLAYFVAAGIDWMWELTVVTVIAIIALALLTGPATARRETEIPLRVRGSGVGRAPRKTGFQPHFGTGIAVMAVAWLALCAQLPPLLADLQISESQDAARSQDTAASLRAALDARRVAPWAASPYTQLALVEEQRGDLERARVWIGGAIRRDRENWRLWLIAARIETQLGDPAGAERSAQRAATLNPRSPLFAEQAIQGS